MNTLYEIDCIKLNEIIANQGKIDNDYIISLFLPVHNDKIRTYSSWFIFKEKYLISLKSSIFDYIRESKPSFSVYILDINKISYGFIICSDLDWMSRKDTEQKISETLNIILEKFDFSNFKENGDGLTFLGAHELKC